MTTRHIGGPKDIKEYWYPFSSELANANQQLCDLFNQLTDNKINKKQNLKKPLKLNLGCGFDKKEGYLNIDIQEFHKPDLVADIRNLYMIPSNSCIEIIAQDCLEHLHRCDVKPALKEWSRLLKNGGVLKLRIPNLLGLFQLLSSDQKQSIEDQEELIQCLYGTQAYDGDYHLSGFTHSLILHYLQDVGFHEINIKSKDEWLFDIIAVKK